MFKLIRITHSITGTLNLLLKLTQFAEKVTKAIILKDYNYKLLSQKMQREGGHGIFLSYNSCLFQFILDGVPNRDGATV